jgi:hypothetical protein
MWTQSSRSVQVMFVPRILKRQVAEADSLQDVGVNIHSGSCNRHTKNRNIKKDRKVESEDQERKWERTTIKKVGDVDRKELNSLIIQDGADGD